MAIINHSELAKLLIAHEGELLMPKLVGDILLATNDGVICEAGPLAKNVKPDWRVDAVFKMGWPSNGEGQATAHDTHATNAKLDAFAPATSGFKFGASSERELVGVHPDLVRVTRRALELCTQDFCVFDGIRTLKEQQALVAKGASKTMQSKHLVGLAVDLVPWIGGKPVWDWDGCYKIAFAMDRAATELGLAHKITWGGAWDRRLSDFGGRSDAYKAEVESYRQRHNGPDFIDGPHFEMEA